MLLQLYLPTTQPDRSDVAPTLPTYSSFKSSMYIDWWLGKYFIWGEISALKWGLQQSHFDLFYRAMLHLLCDLEVLYVENIQLTLVRHFRTLLHFVRHYGIRHSGTNSSSLYDTPNQNVLLAVRRVYLAYQNVLLEFQRIACLSCKSLCTARVCGHRYIYRWS